MQSQTLIFLGPISHISEAKQFVPRQTMMQNVKVTRILNWSSQENTRGFKQLIATLQANEKTTIVIETTTIDKDFIILSGDLSPILQAVAEITLKTQRIPVFFVFIRYGFGAYILTRWRSGRY